MNRRDFKAAAPRKESGCAAKESGDESPALQSGCAAERKRLRRERKRR
jgi:hypothetical protein